MLHATRKISLDTPRILSEARPRWRWRKRFPVPQAQPDNPVHATPPQETGVLTVMVGSSLATLFSGHHHPVCGDAPQTGAEDLAGTAISLSPKNR
jgi:hypothetical protein